MTFLQARSVIEGYAIIFFVLPLVFLGLLELKSWMNKK